MDATARINQAVQEVTRLSIAISKPHSVQVNSKEEQELLKANVFSWFNGHKIHFQALSGSSFLNSIDTNFSLILELADRHTTRARYKSILKQIKTDLIKLRSEAIQLQSSLTSSSDLDSPKPDFVKLISDGRMIQILNRRWDETINCIKNNAPLAAMVMMGALLESLLLARINQLTDKTALFSLQATPKDSKTKKALQLQQWGLNDFIEVAHEMKWIRKPAKEVGVIIRDYRNFIHPVKELSSGFQIEESDARMFWPIFIQISDQIIKSI